MSEKEKYHHFEFSGGNVVDRFRLAAGAVLSAHREAFDMTTVELAKKCGISADRLTTMIDGVSGDDNDCWKLLSCLGYSGKIVFTVSLPREVRCSSDTDVSVDADFSRICCWSNTDYRVASTTIFFE